MSRLIEQWIATVFIIMFVFGCAESASTNPDDTSYSANGQSDSDICEGYASAFAPLANLVSHECS